MSIRIIISSDHAGYSLKQKILAWPQQLFYFEDLGTNNPKSVDYPDYANKLVLNFSEQFQFGILICATGIGMSICANRHNSIRAALCYNIKAAKLAREHNNSNVLVLGARFVREKMARQIITHFYLQKFAGGRHQRRIAKIIKFDI